MDVRTIRDRLKTRLAAVSGLRAFDTIPDEIAPPAAVVAPDGDRFITYPETIKAGICTLRFRIVLIASAASSRTGQDDLDLLLSSGTGVSGSAVDALTADRTLGGAAQTLVVQAAEDYGRADIAGNQYWKADLVVEVTAVRS